MSLQSEPQFQNLAIKDGTTIIPGLLHLSLNILFQPDSDTIDERKEALQISLKEEHHAIHLVVQNLIALLNHRIPRRQNEAREALEDILSLHPRHLNTLAHLEIIYKQLNRMKDASRCKDMKDDIIHSTKNEDIELKAQCYLEQGYALMFEGMANYEAMANLKLKEALAVLSREHERSIGNRKDYLRNAKQHAKTAFDYVQCSMYCTRPDESIKRKEDSVNSFKTGLQLLNKIGKEKSEQYWIWKYYLGKAYNRLDYSLSNQEATVEEYRQKTCGKALQIFWETIRALTKSESCTVTTLYDRRTNTNLDHNLITSELSPVIKLYIGRTCAYLGHIFITRKQYVSELRKAEAISSFPCFQDPTFIHLVENPLCCFDEHALKLCPKDIHIINRYGRTLRSMQRSQTKEQQLSTLKYAYELLSESLTISPRNNWSAYVTRMLVCKDLSYTDKQNREEWLEQGRSNGVECFRAKATDKDQSALAKICQMLAKYPDEKYGPKYVKKGRKKYLYEAVDYLNYALQLGGFVDPKVADNLGGCLYELEDYRPAVEWTKRAMYLSKDYDPTLLARIAEYIFALYNSTKGNANYLFNEIRFVMEEAKSKYKNLDEPVFKLWKYNQKNMHLFLQFVLTERGNAFTRELVNLSISDLEEMKRRDSIDIILDLKSRLENQPDLADSDTDIPGHQVYDKPSVVLPFSDNPSIQFDTYKYDFFISHSNLNKDWVNGFLLHQLETKLDDTDTAFKGCIADRDFEPGKAIIDNIVHAVQNSYKTIFIITDAFIKSRWCDFEINSALAEMIYEKKDDCIIPLLLENTQCPLKLGHITYLDLSDDNMDIEKIMRLKRGLLA